MTRRTKPNRHPITVDAKIVILKGKGHMGASEGFTEIPEILEEMEEIMEIK